MVLPGIMVAVSSAVSEVSVHSLIVCSKRRKKCERGREREGSGEFCEGEREK